MIPPPSADFDTVCWPKMTQSIYWSYRPSFPMELFGTFISCGTFWHTPQSTVKCVYTNTHWTFTDFLWSTWNFFKKKRCMNWIHTYVCMYV